MKKSSEQMSSLVIKDIKRFIEQNGYSPFYREIGTALEIKAISSVKFYIDFLRKNGKLKPVSGTKGRVLVVS